MLLRVINYNFGTEFNISGISNIIFAFAAFSFNEAAYNAETIRASILSRGPQRYRGGRIPWA